MSIELFPIDIGIYENHEDFVEPSMESIVADVANQLSRFGVSVTHPWDTEMTDRDHTAVTSRLIDFRDGQGSAILYWVGHGSSNGDSSYLAHARSPKEYDGLGGICPHMVGSAVVGRLLNQSDESWLWVIVDSCKSGMFVRDLQAAILATLSPGKYVLYGTSLSDSAVIGRFPTELSKILSVTFAGQRAIPLTWLIEELKLKLGGTYHAVNLDRYTELRWIDPTPAIGITIDDRTEFDRRIRKLTRDEKRLLLRAQGGDLSLEGFLAQPRWHFKRRDHERSDVLALLRQPGLTVVTGRAGVGKSALLGDILVRSHPEVYDLLSKHRLISPAVDEVPSFDDAIRLSGLTSGGVIERLSSKLGFGPTDIELALPEQLAQLVHDLSVNETSRNRREFYILADGLDESDSPHEMAATLGQISEVSTVHLIVGTRSSASDSPDQPPPTATELLDTLNVAENRIITLKHDFAAVIDYVQERLAPICITDAISNKVESLAVAIARVNQGFLYAQLAVHEILANPSLIEDTYILDHLGRDCGAIFASAVARLTSIAQENLPLLRALAVSQGNGLPIRAGVWASIASAIDPVVSIGHGSIDELLEQAAPYIAVNQDSNETVYSLAHRTYIERMTINAGLTSAWHSKICSRALEELTSRPGKSSGVDTSVLSRYWICHLSAHFVHADKAMWRQLDQSSVLDLLDPTALKKDIDRGIEDRSSLPNLEACSTEWQTLNASAIGDRHGILQLQRFRLPRSNQLNLTTSLYATWTLQWASLSPGATGTVRSMASVKISNGRTTIATGDNTGEVRLWDGEIGYPLAEIGSAHSGPVRTIASGHLKNGYPVFATGGEDGAVRMWDAATGDPVGRPLTDLGPVYALALLPPADGSLLAVASRKSMPRLWDPVAGVSVGDPLPYISGTAAAGVVTGAGTSLVTGDSDGKTRIWDLAAGTPPMEPPATSRLQGPIVAVASVPLSTGDVLVATVGGEHHGAIQFWDPTGSTRSGQPEAPIEPRAVGKMRVVRNAPVRAATSITTGGRAKLATGHSDGTVWLWDVDTRVKSGHLIHDQQCSVNAVAAITTMDDRALASGGDDGIVRLWNPATRNLIGELIVKQSTPVRALAEIATIEGLMLLAVGHHDGTVRLWDPATCMCVGHVFIGHTAAVTALVPIPTADGRVLVASASEDHTIRLWNPTTGAPEGNPLRGHAGPVRTLSVIPTPDGRVLLVSAGDDRSARVWDPAAEPIQGVPLLANDSRVWSMATAPTETGHRTLLVGYVDGTAQGWDPLRRMPTGKSMTGHTSAVRAMSTINTTDGWWLATADSRDGEGSVCLWNAVSGQRIRTIVDAQTVLAVARVTNADGCSRLAASFLDGTVRIWDPLDSEHSVELRVASPGSTGLPARSLAAAGPGLIALGFDDGVAVIRLI